VRRVLAVACAAASLSACAFPTRNPATLHAIRSEAAALMATHPVKPPNDWANVPEKQWPAAIASLKPEHVTVYRWGVDIVVKPSFDGGWGYQIARNRKDLPNPQGCYSKVYGGVFWYGPC
jgi:hypothetical protein